MPSPQSTPRRPPYFAAVGGLQGPQAKAWKKCLSQVGLGPHGIWTQACSREAGLAVETRIEPRPEGPWLRITLKPWARTAEGDSTATPIKSDGEGAPSPDLREAVVLWEGPLSEAGAIAKREGIKQPSQLHTLG